MNVTLVVPKSETKYKTMIKLSFYRYEKEKPQTTGKQKLK